MYFVIMYTIININKKIILRIMYFTHDTHTGTYVFSTTG